MTRTDRLERIHVMGASGSGTTTLGIALAERLGATHCDVDDHYWMPTDPPFSTKRPVADRLAMMRAALARSARWVLSGSLVGWGEPAIEDAQLIVFVTVPTPVRLERLLARERHRHGDAILPGGPMEAIHAAFMAWAAGYDDPTFDGRSRHGHEAWLAAREVPVCRVDGDLPTARQVEQVLAMAGG